VTARAVRLSNWDERIARARALADSRPAAGEVLAFYAALAGFQKSLVDADELAPAEIRGPSSSPASFLGPIELERALNAIPRFLEWLPTAGPEPLIESMDTVRDFSRDEWADLAGSFSDTVTRGSSLGPTDGVAVTEGVAQGFSPASIDDPLTLFVLEAVLQPFAERLARQRSLRSPLEGRAPLHCPRCGAPPVVAVLREEGHSAKRFLLCALCLTEWQCLSGLRRAGVREAADFHRRTVHPRASRRLRSLPPLCEDDRFVERRPGRALCGRHRQRVAGPLGARAGVHEVEAQRTRFVTLTTPDLAARSATVLCFELVVGGWELII
jgi:hypothetical protein